MSVGEMLREELRTRGWTQEAFARLIGRSPQWVSEVLNGKKSVTPWGALQLEAALGISSETLLNLQSAYAVAAVRADRIRKRELIDIRRRVQGRSR